MDFTVCILAWIIIFGVPAVGQSDGHLASNVFLCSQVGGTHCDGKSLETTVLISCLSKSVAEFHSCNVQLVNILPDGYKESALCYESAERDGNAVCAFNGTGYPLDGSSFSLPESLLSNLESLRNPAVPGLSSLSTATQGIAIPALTSPGDLPIPTVTTPPPRGTITKSKVSEPTAVNDSGCPAYMPTKTIRLSSIARSSNATPKTTVFLSSYRATAYSTETIQIVLATTKSSSPGTLRPMSVVSLAVGDSSKAGVSSSMVTSTVFGTLTHSGWSSIANAAPPYPGQGAFVALLAFAAAVF